VKARIESGLVDTVTDHQQKLNAQLEKSHQAQNAMKALLSGGNMKALAGGSGSTLKAIEHKPKPLTIAEIPDKVEQGVIADQQRQYDKVMAEMVSLILCILKKIINAIY
jgi:hypothetical protein